MAVRLGKKNANASNTESAIIEIHAGRASPSNTDVDAFHADNPAHIENADAIMANSKESTFSIKA